MKDKALKHPVNVRLDDETYAALQAWKLADDADDDAAAARKALRAFLRDNGYFGKDLGAAPATRDLAHEITEARHRAGIRGKATCVVQDPYKPHRGIVVREPTKK